MKDLGVWDDVAVLIASDFARTLDSNGPGTDHAWRVPRGEGAAIGACVPGKARCVALNEREAEPLA